MSRQLDILALEPFHGGVRRAMLEAISRCSRHRWTILKLPARRIERRLMVAATWFAEHIARNPLGNVDVVFSSEALNLAEFLRLRPELARKPSVVYFHDNQLPEPGARNEYDSPADLVNLNSATAAGEIWFNSLYNLRSFLSRASGMVSRHPELQNPNPMPQLTAKSHLVPPPIDLAAMQTGGSEAPVGPRPTRAVVFDTRDGDQDLIASTLATLARRREPMDLTLIGRPNCLPASLQPTILNERADAAHVRALRSAGLFVTTRADAAADDLTVRALAAGCLVVAPDAGVYPELLPEGIHDRCLHDGTIDSLVERILDAWYLEAPNGWEFHLDEALAQFQAIPACKVIDERLDAMADVRPTVQTRFARRSAVAVPS